MIWYKSQIKIPGQPEDIGLEIVGLFNDRVEQPLLPLIQIIVRSTSGASKELYSHNPSMLLNREPDKEDILTRYAAKLNKCHERIMSQGFSFVLGLPDA